MPRIKSVLSALAIGLVLIMGLDYVSYAATGQALILGQLNKSGATTTVQNTGTGPAATFKVKNTTGAPIAVNGTGKVAKLNADFVDGRSASDLAPLAFGYVSLTGTLQGGRGVVTTSYDAAASSYLITIADTSYIADRFATVVTTSCNAVTGRTTAFEGNLVVYLRDNTNKAAQCGFGFVVYALPAP